MGKLTNFLLSILLFLFPNSQNLPAQIQNIPVVNTKIILAGDIMLGRSVMTKSLGVNDPVYPFRKVADRLNQADIVFANLENPIVTNCPLSNSGFKFCANPKMVEGLKLAGVDIVSLANNHILNYGEEGKEETEKILTDNGIAWVGDGNLEVIEKNGTKFGFLGFDLMDKLPKDSDYQLIKDSKSKVDILIVMVHWGVEYTPEPASNQKIFAGNLVNAGADVVSGSHPHWVQTIEYINEKPVFYSLGNFIFDQEWSEETKKGLAVQLTYRNGQLLNVEKLPVYIRNFVQPEWVQPQD
jgi:poly-gamma-glutamate capsule biosynthesis protein CapA/YwtB (metallophosphatase superfamily)